MLTSKEIRESYKDFFKSKGHVIVPSAPMVININESDSFKKSMWPYM